MTRPDYQRRRFLVLLGGLGGVALFGRALWWLGDRDDEIAAVPPDTSTTSSLPSVTTTLPPVMTTTTSVPVIAIPVICREAWRAQPAGSGMEPHEIVQLTVHHTAAPIDDVSFAPNHILGHQRFHQNDKGWADIAYHYLIDPGGNIYEGRDPAFRGDTATNYDPSGHFLICLDGDFDSAVPSQAQVDSLVDMLAYGASYYSVDPSTIGGHRDYASTSCPGANVYSIIEEGKLQAMVRDRLRRGVPIIELLCGEVGASVVADIENA